jgi:Flp pilus assembly protein TadB
MGTIYQLTFFLGLGLLAIVITIFVFAVSLLGRAMEAAARSEKDKLAERRKSNTEQMAAIRKEIEEAEAKGQIPKGLTRKLDKLEKKDKKFEKEQSKIRKAPELLTAKGGVYYTCVFLVITLVTSGVALYLSTLKDMNFLIPLLIWIAGLITAGYGIYRICQSLRVIQSVAVTSEEAWLKRTIDAFKIAEKELEEEKRPEITLKYLNVSFPLKLKPDSEKDIVIE